MVCLVLLAGFTVARADDNARLVKEVAATERAFAATMAARDHEAFSRYVAEEAVFFDGMKTLRGKAAIASAWKNYFQHAEAPFSWTPETVVVLDSGTLAHSSGPVFNSQGKRISTFNSVWRRDSDGVWRVIFDKGCDACACEKAP
jgi:ketosteroid isomerase-like protein